jgi:hypothetical protein
VGAVFVFFRMSIRWDDNPISSRIPHVGTLGRLGLSPAKPAPKCRTPSIVLENTYPFDCRFFSTGDPVQYKDRKLQGLSNAVRWILVFRDTTMTGLL